MRAPAALSPAFLLAVAIATNAGGQPVPPAARRAPATFEIHGRTLVDPYPWLEDASDPEVIAYLEAENRYAMEAMRGTEALQSRLFREMASRADEAGLQPPRLIGNDAYYVRSAVGSQYQVLCRRVGGLEGREQVLFDLNTLATEGRKPAFGVWRISPDSRLLAASVDFDGSESFTIFIRSLEGRRQEVEEVAGAGRWLEWAADSRTLFYTSPYGQAPRLTRQQIGSPESRPREVYAEHGLGTSLGLMKTATGNHLVLITYGSEWEIRVLPASDPAGDPSILAPRRKGVRYWAAEDGGWFYLLENSAGAASRIRRTRTDTVQVPRWEDVLAPGLGWLVSDFDVAGGKLLAEVREDGLGRIRALDPATGATSLVPLPEPMGSVRLVSAFERDPQPRRSPASGSVQLYFESFVQPRTLFKYDPRKARLRETWRVPVHHYRAHDYETRRVFATAPDGTRIPVSLAYRKPLVLDGRRPLLLQGFGFVGLASDPSFESERASLLDRGVVFGVAHIRGGGEFGLAWHEAATGLNKIRTFTDFIACAKHLIGSGFTSADRLAITGTSAGGMLVTAVANMRPDLVRAVVAKVPATVVIRRQPGTSTLQDNPELGNPNREPDFNAMLAYAPYFNVRPQAYPHMLVTASRSDPRVTFSDPVKFTARLRAVWTGNRMLLLRVDTSGGGHTGSAGRDDRLRETAFEYAFLFQALGIQQ